VSNHRSAPRTLNMPLLERLRVATGNYVPFDQLGPEPAHVHTDLAALVDFGFGIEHHPHHGVAYRHPAHRLCPDQLEFELDTETVGRRIAVWNRVGSTNDVASRAARSVANDGLVVLAEAQTAGRGRRGREWVAPAHSSILMSVLLSPSATLETHEPACSVGTSWLTALASVAVAETISTSTGLTAKIKWPNDVRIDGRKVAGILVERPTPAHLAARSPVELDRHDHASHPAIIGIGLNVNTMSDGFPPALENLATSLRIETRRSEPLDRSEIARGLMRSLDRWYSQCLSGGMDALSKAWSNASEHLERTVHVETHNGSYTGVVIDLDLRRGLTLAVSRSSVDQSGTTSSLSISLPVSTIHQLKDPTGGSGRPMRSEHTPIVVGSRGPDLSRSTEVVNADT
jgi:BirA family biotin operon repressor/biotin-[acetyl-CoA-carboxylase] ligase